MFCKGEIGWETMGKDKRSATLTHPGIPSGSDKSPWDRYLFGVAVSNEAGYSSGIYWVPCVYSATESELHLYSS